MDAAAGGWPVTMMFVPADGPAFPVHPDERVLAPGRSNSFALKVQRLLSIDLDPEQFHGDEPDVVTITMGGAPVRYVRETEVR